MQCPFPGMDPYIERPPIWPDFHDCLITAIRSALQPLLRPRFAALVQDRLYVVQSKRPIFPDVAVVETGAPKGGPVGGAALLELDEPVVFRLIREEIREPYIEIVELAAGNRLVTAIEVLSPDNKAAGAGRRAYLRKQKELRAAGVNLVEIDLLRAGKPTLQISRKELATLPPWRYIVAVMRHRKRHEVYAVPLQKRLPRFGIPLTAKDRDVPLDLQAAFTRTWLDAAYPELLQYEGPPPGETTPEELAWCDERLRAAGFRPSEPGA